MILFYREVGIYRRIGICRIVGIYGIICRKLISLGSTANRATLSFGKTGCATSGSNRLVNNLGVSLERYTFTLLLAAITVTSLYAVFSAGGVLGNRPFAKAMFMATTSR